MDSICAKCRGFIVIPAANPGARYLEHKAEIDDAIESVLSSGNYILGRNVDAFEKEFSAYTGTAYAVGTGSGTDALQLALRACGIKDGDEVITPSHTAVATAAAIRLTGARPVFVDIESDTYTIDPELIVDAITPQTRAIVPVHLYGTTADIGRIIEIARKRDIRVIEDAAQAHGARYNGMHAGSTGDMGCFSFYPTKNMGGFGDAGCVITNDPTLAERARCIREYGWNSDRTSEFEGINTRLDEIHAAVLRVFLKYLDIENIARNSIAAWYRKFLSDCPAKLPTCRKECTHTYHLYVIQTELRDKLREYLAKKDIATNIHYPVPIHMQPAYKQFTSADIQYPLTEKAASEVLSLPMYPGLTEPQVETVSTAVNEFFENQ